MILYPDVQWRAQQELDVIIGRWRLVASADKEKLPYLNALMKEVLRWSNIAPLGLAHRARVDDIYEGQLIPKGALVFANIWYNVIVIALTRLAT